MVGHMGKQPTISKIVVRGSTEWSAKEEKSVGRFARGSQRIQVQVKDDKGKPAYRARRLIAIWVCCADGVSYRFGNDADMRHDPSINIHLHGTSFHVSSFDDDAVPVNVRAAYARTARKVRACLRIMRAEFAALPAYRAL